MYSILLEWAKIAGIAGMAFGTLLVVYRAAIGKLKSPDEKDSGSILRLIVILTFAIGILGILVYACILIFVPINERTPYKVSSVTDEIDFREWNISKSSTTGLYRGSAVRRSRTIVIVKTADTNVSFHDRNTTTGQGIEAEIPNHDAGFTEVHGISGHTNHEYVLSVSPASFASGTHKLIYTLTYWNAWREPRDNWVAKPIEYPTTNYHFILHFPTPWRSVRVSLQPPGATDEFELSSVPNIAGRLDYEWTSDPGQLFKPGSRLMIYFDWPHFAEPGTKGAQRLSFSSPRGAIG